MVSVIFTSEAGKIEVCLSFCFVLGFVCIVQSGTQDLPASEVEAKQIFVSLR